MNKSLYCYFISFLLLLGCLAASKNSFGQTVTITSENSTSANGITNGPLINGTTAIVLFGFKVTEVGGTGVTITSFELNGGTGGLFTNGKLYKTAAGATTYSGATQVVGATISIVNNNPQITGLNENITNTNFTYFVVADLIPSYGVLPATVQYTFSQYNYVSTYSGSATGVSFSCVNPTVTFAPNTTGVSTQSTIYNGQTGVVWSGVTLSVNGGSITISNAIINYSASVSNPTSSYFSNLALYMSTTGLGPMGSGSTLVSTAAFAQSGGNIVVTTGTNVTINAATSVTFYLVMDLNTRGGATMPTSFTLDYGNIYSNSPAVSYTNSSGTTAKTYSLIYGSVSFADNNFTGSGITQGSISYGQTGIVLFSFSLTVQGALTVSNMYIPSNVNLGQYFNNGKLYRSNNQYYSNATAVSGAILNFNAGVSAVQVSGLSEVFTSGSPTTYYYFVVADLTATTSFTTPATAQYFLSSSQPTAAVTASNGSTYNTTSTITGSSFNIVATYDWLGGTSSDFSNVANFGVMPSGPAGSLPNSSITVNIGRVAYTNAPNVTASTTIGGLSFGTAVASPILTIASGQTLTVNNNMIIQGGNNATITGNSSSTSTITLANSVTATSIASTAQLNLNNVKLNNAGLFTMASTSTLNLSNSILANTGTFTFVSDANSTARLGPLVGTNTITGNYIVQRYITGGSSTYRGYRSMSSPVSGPSSAAYYNLSFLAGSGSYLSGAAGGVGAGGFDVSGAPTMYLYNQGYAATTGSVSSGNFRAITKINNSPTYNLGTLDGNFNMPVGNGYFFFFRGNNSTNISATPNNLTFNMSGTLNTGQITVKDWFNQSASTLAYSTVTGNAAVIGFNLVGNPYPSSIDWHTNYGNNTATTGICCATGLSNSIYVYNTTTKNYSIYTNNSATTGTASGASGGSNIIPSGQGFFVRATAIGAKLIFNESAKIGTQPATLLLNALPNPIVDHHLRLQLFKDTINKDETVIIFNSTASATFAENEDALYLQGTGLVNLSNMTSDNVAVGLNEEPFPTKTQTIGLNVIATSDGDYQLKMTEVSNIPDLFDVWLKDAYMQDSLDIKHNPNYSFNLAHSDAASVSAQRFTLVIRQNTAYAYHLLSFNGAEIKGGAQLTWTTENEDTYTTFILQRSTDGGKTFVPLTTIPSDGGGTYSYLDANPAPGQNQYRLQITDVNGVIAYSNVVQLLYPTSGNSTITVSNISIYPNPANDVINVSIAGATAGAATYTATIINSDGSVVRKIASMQSAWQGTVSDLSPGVYILRVVDATNQQVVGVNKFIKL